MGETRLPRPNLSGLGAGISVIAGIVASAMLSFVWAFLITILTTTEFRMPYLWMIAAGAILGPLVAVTRFRGATRPILAPAIGLLVGIVWFAVTGFNPLGMDGLPFWEWLGPPVIFAGSAYMIRTALRETDLGAVSRDARDKLVVRLLRGLGILFYLLVVALPFYFMLASSLKSRASFVQDPTNLAIPFGLPIAELFVGYVEVLTRFRFARYILNSAVVSFSTVVLTLVPAILGAYAVTRLHFPGRKVFSRSILLIYMFPAIVLVIPLYSIFSRLGLRDTLPGLLVVYPAMTIPVALYMLRSYFQTLPRDIEDQGLVDGLTRFKVITHITIPLSAPALASVGLYVFMIAWNEFLFAFMFLDSPQIFTLSRGMVALNSQEVPRQFLMAGAVIITVPIMILFFWFEKYLVGGLTAGGVKE